jgi:hypothetical protein
MCHIRGLATASVKRQAATAPGAISRVNRGEPPIIVNLSEHCSQTPMCRYARDWILSNVTLCRTEDDALAIAQEMMNLGIFHEIYDSPTFSIKSLFFFSEKGRGMLPLLRQRIVSVEDQILSQIKTHKQEQTETSSRTIELDWRISVVERRLSTTERALRRGLAAQQLLMASVLAMIVIRYVPVSLLVMETMSALAAVLVVVALLESRLVLLQFLDLQVRPASV